MNIFLILLQSEVLYQWPLESRVIALKMAALHFSIIREETLLSFWTLSQFIFTSFVCHSGKHVDVPFPLDYRLCLCCPTGSELNIVRSV